MVASMTNRRPRIAIITRSIDRSGTSGSGHHLREMVRHLIPQAPDLDITLAHYGPSGDDVYSLAPELILPTNPFRAAAVLNSHQFDVVHFSPLTIVSPINGLRARTSATIHSAEPILLPEAYSWLKRFHSAQLIPRYARRLDALVTVSQTSRQWFATNYRVAPERIFVTYNACAPAYRRLSDEERAAAGTLPVIPGPFILHVSRFSERKNPWTMLQGFAGLLAGTERESGAEQTLPTNLYLVLAGKGWDDPEVLRRATELGIRERVITPGYVAEETVVQLLNRAEVFWFPSLSEGFGIPNIEAMRCGCPVITSAVFAIPEVVGDAAVVLDDPRDATGLAEATRNIVTNPAERNSLIQAGFAWSSRYSWQDSAGVLADVFRELARR
jgi:glycosyltransferase involved in cell wall biosynthesis